MSCYQIILDHRFDFIFVIRCPSVYFLHVKMQRYITSHGSPKYRELLDSTIYEVIIKLLNHLEGKSW